MTKLHRFQRYSQPENVVTNNVLMLLSRMYEYRSSKFERVLGRLMPPKVNEANAIEIGPRFTQQIKGPKRVADGLIRQSGFDLLIETKLHSSFDVDQAIDHLEHIVPSSQAILMLLGREPRADDAALNRLYAAAASLPRVQIVVCSFKALIDACRSEVALHEDELGEMIDDFEDFCLDEDILPIDDQTLFVPPCSESLQENLRWSLYYCPATRPRRSGLWFGPYGDKRVHAIGRIDKVVDVASDGQRLTTTSAVTDEERSRILGAIDDAKARGWDLLEQAHTFYLCSDMQPTTFAKDSPGGIPGHRYFDLSPIRQSRTEPLSARLIAERLRDRRWSEL